MLLVASTCIFLYLIRPTITDCYPETLCDYNFSSPSDLKTSSDRVIHIAVSLRIIHNNNNRDSILDFDKGFKNDIKLLFTNILRLSSGKYCNK